MRRFAKMIPQEISLTQEGANRRVIATYKSRTKPGEEDITKGGPGSGPQKGGGGSALGGAASNQDLGPKDHMAQAMHHASVAREATEVASRAGRSRQAKLQEKASANLNLAQSSLKLANIHADLADKKEKLAALEAAHRSQGQGRVAKSRPQNCDEGVGFGQDPIKQQLAANQTSQSNSHGAAMNIQEAIENTPFDIVRQLESVTKSATANGKSYTPQAASVMKAVGRMLAPFSDELNLDDLKTIGMAAGFDGADEATTKSVNKGKPEEDDTEAGSADQGEAMDFNAEESDADDEQEMVDDEEPEDDEEEEGEEPTPVKKSVLAENIALKAKKDDTGSDAEAESEASEEDSAEEEEPTKPANAKAWGQPKGTKAKGETVAKSATSGSSAGEEQYSEIRKSLERQRQENEELKEAFAKARKDLDDERNFRALENIKKSVKADYAHLNVDVDALAPVLKSLKEAKDASMYEQLTATLKAADAQVKAAQSTGGVFQSVGKSSARSAAAGAGATWADKIEARVEEEFKKNAKGRVKAQVYDAFTDTDEGREMLANHRVEMAQQRGY